MFAHFGREFSVLTTPDKLNSDGAVYLTRFSRRKKSNEIQWAKLFLRASYLLANSLFTQCFSRSWLTAKLRHELWENVRLGVRYRAD